MADTINIASKQSGDTLTAGELNTIVTGTNAAITEQNETKAAHAEAIAAEITARSNADALKVDKVEGKGLSTEDYTTTEKNKLAALNEHDKGFFDNEAAIIAAHPAGQAGWFCRNGETDTIWTWDVETEAWVDTGTNIEAETGETIKTKLETLEGDNRLDASAIKNLPSGGDGLTKEYRSSPTFNLTMGGVIRIAEFIIDDPEDDNIFEASSSSSVSVANVSDIAIELFGVIGKPIRFQSIIKFNPGTSQIFSFGTIYNYNEGLISLANAEENLGEEAPIAENIEIEPTNRLAYSVGIGADVATNKNYIYVLVHSNDDIIGVTANLYLKVTLLGVSTPNIDFPQY